MRRFEDDRYYLPSDDEMRLLGTEGTLAWWRSTGGGPKYSKPAKRVIYLGRDLNAFIDATTVDREPVAA